MKIKKIAIITPFSYKIRVGGVEFYTKILKSVLEKNGIEVDVFDESLINEYSNTFSLIYKLGNIKSLYNSNYDLYICNGGSGFNIRHFGIKSINIYLGDKAGYFINNKSKDSKNYMYNFVGYVFELISGINRTKVAVSTGVKNDLEKYYNFSNIEVIGSTVDTDLFKPINDRKNLKEKYGIDLQKKVLFFSGRWEYMKGNDVLFKLIKDMSSLKIQFLIASSNIADDDKRLLESYGTVVLGDIKNDTIHELYKVSDLFIFPSRFEGSSFSLLEAMSSGLPFVISKVGNAIDIYNENEVLSEYILDDFNVDVWVLKINNLLNNPDIYSNISRMARKYVIENYSLDNFERKYMSIIHKIEDQ